MRDHRQHQGQDSMLRVLTSQRHGGDTARAGKLGPHECDGRGKRGRAAGAEIETEREPDRPLSRPASVARWLLPAP